MDSNLGLYDHYKLKRLVYVNSANHAYSEIMLDSNIAMFGDNNVGKTASLAGMKLLLYPEVDFYRCENKFSFKGKNGLFSMEESYSFYFPDARSFIVLEVENPEGTFCMVLHKRKDFGYGRFFIPVAYEALRELFWVREHAKFSDDISIHKVRDFVTIKDGIQLSDSLKISDLIYNGYRQNKEKQRYCILPLRDDSKESITAFRSIYQLAFEISNLDDKTLPNAIATLLEMNRGRKQEKLDADLTKLSLQHSELYQKGEWLQKLSNTENLFSRVDSEYEHLQESIKKYSLQLYSVNKAVESAKSNYATESATVETEYEGCKVQVKTAEQNLKALAKSNNTKSGELNGLRKEHKEKLAALENAKQLRASYGDTPDQTVISWLDDEVKKAQNKLEAYQSEEKTKQTLQENIQKSNSLQIEIKKIEGLIENSSSSILNQIGNDSSANVLNSLNPNFSTISKLLNSNEKNVINQFTELFNEAKGRLYFLAEQLGDTLFQPTSIAQQLEQNEAKLKRKKKELNDLNGDIEEQNQALKSDNLAELINKQSIEVKDIEQEKNAISGLGVLKSDETTLKQKVDDLDMKLQADEIQHGKDEKALKVLAEKFQEISERRSNLLQLNNNLEQITTSLKNAKQAMQPIAVDVEALERELLTVEYANTVLTQANSCRGKYTNFIQSFNQLEKQLPHPDLVAHKQLSYIAEYDVAIQSYKSSYATLEYENQQHNDEVRTHNHKLTNQLNELKEAKNFLFNFVTEINKELNNKPISNLSEIKLNLELKANFLSLIDTIDKVDIQDGSLVDFSFYKALSSFVEQHFNKQKGRLKMKDIIDNVKYQYKFEETEEWVTKSQSGGTTTAITATVLSVLLKRLSPIHVQLQMPIIVDEISVMDTDNTESTLNQITEHGFSIFCATPTFSASLGETVGNWLMIDQATVSQPMIKHCHFNVMPEDVESFGANSL